jgi:hypothetical protein
MCIISSSVNKVSDTKILIAVNEQTDRQLVVYSNKIDNNSSKNAMILPVPIPDSIKFINLSNYKNIFEDCEKSFYNATRSLSVPSSLSFGSRNMLEVFSVGSYNVSLAKSLDDLKKVNTNVFNLTEGCEKLLSADYSDEIWGFIICQLNEGLEKYHPFAYSHQLMDTVFIPTKHYHDHKVNGGFKYNNVNITNSPMFSTFNSENVLNRYDYADDWSHDIYLMNVKNTSLIPKSMNSSNFIWTKKMFINKNLIDFDFGNVSKFDKVVIEGSHKNIDLTIPL